MTDIRKRTREGKSMRMKVIEPLQFIAKDNINKTITLSFTIDYYKTAFSITLTENKFRDIVEQSGILK